MKCPNCNETLVMADRQGVEIDYCPQCRGVWLDKGELDKIVERSAQYNSSAPDSSGSFPPDQGYHEKDYKKQDYPQKKKRGGFLGDLFDFD